MFSLFSKKIQNFPIGKKMLSIVFISHLLTLSAVLTGFILLTNANNQLIYQTTADSLSNSASKLYDALANIDAMSAAIAVDKNLQNLLAKVKNNSVNHEIYPAIYNRLESYFQQFQYNHLEYIMLRNHSFLSNTYVSEAQKLPEEVLEDLTQSAQNQYGKAVWVTSYSKKYGLFLVREIRRIENAQFDTLGIIIININTNALLSDSSYYSSQYSRAASLLCCGDSVIGSDSLLTAKDIQTIKQDFSFPYKLTELDSGKYFVVKNELPDFAWDFYSLIPYSMVYTSVRTAQLLFFSALALSLICAIFLSRYFISNLTIHFDRLIWKINTFRDKKGSLLAEEDVFDYADQKDELGILHQQFDSMATQIYELINVNLKNELLVKDAQIKALETQINPHFLYNTLESINWRAKASHEQEISLMVESLGTLMRASLSHGTKTFSIQQELHFLNSYINIQQIRFEEQLFFSLKEDLEIMEIQIPKLILQPLVENAIHYALEENMEACCILVLLSHDSDHIYMDVKNTGSQFKEQLLEKLYDQRIEPNGLGIGLLNIDQRIKLTFGSVYGLTLFNEPPYAVVRVTLPYAKED